MPDAAAAGQERLGRYPMTYVGQVPDRSRSRDLTGAPPHCVHGG